MDEATSAGSNPASEGIGASVSQDAPSAVPSISDALERAFENTGAIDDSAEQFGTAPAKPDTKAALSADAGQPRAPDGKFAAKAAAEAVEPAPVDPAAIPAPDAAKPAHAPPARFTKEAQEAWAAAPDTLKSEVLRLESELTKGIEKYKTSHDAYETVRKFDEMARQSGTKLDVALDRYVGMENMLRTDFVGGIKEICRNMGVDPVQVAQHLANMQPTGGSSPHEAALLAKIAELENRVGSVQQTFSQERVMQQIQAFAADKPRFDELSETMSEMIQTGFAKNLQDAYDKADRLIPAAPSVAAATVPQVTIPVTKSAETAQTRKANLSITGSPSGSNPGTRKPAGSALESLDRAFDAVGL